ncbi:MAG: indole-3-glycerol-phosphate synthase [Acidobacteria bacterium]|nr:indole-3-glycerol-phosphate synthase [Acidobacteriota bacterium]
MLETIARATRERIAREPLCSDPATLRDRLATLPPPREFRTAILGGPGIIAEVKMRSPSAGCLGHGLDPVDVARQYAANGASAISVLTEPDFFGGSIQHLSAIRNAVDLPLLMKDFIVDESQVQLGRLNGADCILLIVALLGSDTLARLRRAAAGLGLDTLIEVHSEEEMDIAIQCGATMIGVNNRDLKSLEVDLEVSRRLARVPRPEGTVLISESGITRGEQIAELSALGYAGFLIGTHFIRTGGPGAALAGLLARGVRA